MLLREKEQSRNNCNSLNCVCYANASQKISNSDAIKKNKN